MSTHRWDDATDNMIYQPADKDPEVAHADMVAYAQKHDGMPVPTPAMMQPVHVDWADLHERLQVRDPTGEWRTLFGVQPCPVCGGSTLLQADIIDMGELRQAPCPACDAVGVLPTLRALRLLHERAAKQAKNVRDTQKGARYVAEVILAQRDALAAGDFKEEPLIVQVDADMLGGTKGQALPVPLHTRKDADTLLDTLVPWADGLDAVAAVHESVVTEALDLQALVKKARATQAWLVALEDWVAAGEQQQARRRAAAPVPAPPAKCHCGKPATVDGLCKRHAYEAGAIAHTAAQLKAADDTPVCDWCEERRGRVQHDGYWYCGPCATDAGLPEVA